MKKVKQNYKLKKVKEHTYMLYQSDNIYTNIMIEAISDDVAVSVANDHIPLLEGCVLEEEVLINLK
ncbi:hypothetical protein [Carboxylicivirga sp. M1479]|uniref:hypothetical protein n=1 Tax=Carboxylicivirga sp. M1479 TaxID=2594476 RepID=UPI001177C3B4|nr:hypothetical protein [Carboxylicivirga sp. M1479]TRX71526.1 hypothetical protein FNN09_06025 [Carboxylicivirga sp. M1479]